MSSYNQIKRLEKLEDRALELGDLQTAIRLNWLRNAVKFDGMSKDRHGTE